jgi:HSP20 family molecular chaperone IbpA
MEAFIANFHCPEGAMTDKAEATFKNGVLEVTMPAPKVEQATRKLEVKDATAEKKAKAAA